MGRAVSSPRTTVLRLPDLVKENITLNFLSPYSPELNSFEKLWWLMKHCWIALTRRTIEELEQVVNHILANFFWWHIQDEILSWKYVRSNLSQYILFGFASLFSGFSTAQPSYPILWTAYIGRSRHGGCGRAAAICQLCLGNVRILPACGQRR